ncbi:RNA polymerase sigma factor [Bacillus sp. PS06]|nr:RNA polymerase sigma factor [Bacillus sp. PS06]
MKLRDWYEHHSDSIFKYLVIMLKDVHQAEDLTQETFIKGYKSFHHFDYLSSEKTWLFKIARNLAIDSLRREKRTRLIKQILHVKENTVSPSSEQLVVIQEEIGEFYHILSGLKETYREVILLRKVKEFSTKETALILGWSESKVKSTLSRGLSELESKLIEEGFTYEELS